MGVTLAGLVALGCLAQAWRVANHHRSLVPAVVAPVSPAAVRPLPARPAATTAPPVRAVVPPVRVEVPAVGLDAAVVAVGIGADGSIEVPPPSVAGWYRLGGTPGAAGPSVLVGHVDWTSGPAVFYHLTAVRAGDEVFVARADGSVARFVVDGVSEVRKAAFPANAIFAPTIRPTLRLITCWGTFDEHTRHYLSSLIVWATAE